MLLTISDEISVSRLVNPSDQTTGLTRVSRAAAADERSRHLRGRLRIVGQSMEYIS